jgi:hypothetical protein
MKWRESMFEKHIVQMGIEYDTGIFFVYAFVFHFLFENFDSTYHIT